MALIHPNTQEIMLSELELFSLPPTQTSIEDTFYEKYYPQTSLDKNGPLDFQVPPKDELYIDPQFIFLYLKCRILDEDGNALPSQTAADNAAVPDKSYVFPINYFHATLFKSVDVFLNNKSVTSNDTMYGYKAYIESLLSYGFVSKEEQLRAAMFYKDKDPMDESSDAVGKTGANQSKNSGAVGRFKRTRYSAPFETFGKLHTEITNQCKLIPGDVELNIKLSRQDSKFVLMAKDTTKRPTISIDTAILFVCHKRISDSIRLAHKVTLQKDITMKYPVRKVQMKFFTRGMQRSDLSEPNLINGTLPRRIIIGLVDSAAFNGDLSKSPFNFQHFNMTSVVLRKNGQAVPFSEIEMNFEQKCALQGYLALMSGTGNLFRNNHGLHIQPFADFGSGYGLLAFDLTPDHADGNTFHLIKQGNVSLDIKLEKPSEAGITIVCYCEYDAIIEIQQDGTVTYE